MNKYIKWTVETRTKFFECGSNGLWCERVDPVWSRYSALHAVFVKNKRTPLYPGVELLNGVLINERDNVSGWTRGDTYSKQESALIMSHQPATMLCATPRRQFVITPPIVRPSSVISHTSTRAVLIFCCIAVGVRFFRTRRAASSPPASGWHLLPRAPSSRYY